MSEKVKPSITIQNVVASFSLTPTPLDLEKIHYAFTYDTFYHVTKKESYSFKTFLLETNGWI